MLDLGEPMKPKTDEQNPKLRKRAKGYQFSLVLEDVEQIENLRLRYQRLALEKSNRPVDITKSELVRAGIYALIKMQDPQFFKRVEEVEELKEGREPKEKPEEK